MEKYIIQPWGTAEQDLEAVPAELTQLAKKVTTQYDMKLLGMEMITSKPDKGGAIWRIDTNKGPRSLKVLHRTPERSLFSVGAQEYLVNQGARVPKLIPANSGKNYVEAGGKLWIVTDWIDLTPASQLDLEGFGMICYGLGEFHQHSKGYIPPFGAKFSSRLHAYPRQYQKMATKINWFRELARAYSEMPASRMLLTMVDKYERQAIQALESLNNSPYHQLVTKGEPHWGLAHQDYGFSNGQLGPKGVWIIDLDGVSYDLPIRDLRKLVTSSMEDKGAWDVNWMNGMIQAYHQANPIDPDLFQVFLVDMTLPNEFYKHVKEIIYSPTTLMNQELEALLTNIESLDATKWKALQQLSKEWKVGGKNIPNWERIAKENAPAKRRKKLIPVPETEPMVPVPETEPMVPVPEEKQRKRLIPRKRPLQKPKRKVGLAPIQRPKRKVGLTPIQRPKRKVGLAPIQRPKRKVGLAPIQRPKRKVGLAPIQRPKRKVGLTPIQRPKRKVGLAPIQRPKRRVGLTPIQRPKRKVSLFPIHHPKRKVAITTVQKPKNRINTLSNKKGQIKTQPDRINQPLLLTGIRKITMRGVYVS